MTLLGGYIMLNSDVEMLLLDVVLFDLKFNLSLVTVFRIKGLTSRLNVTSFIDVSYFLEYLRTKKQLKRINN